jgi:hypothetical protein
VVTRPTETGSVVGLYIAKTSTDGIQTATRANAQRAGRYTAKEHSARNPAGVAEIENIPNRMQASATPRGRRRRHHSDKTASVPQAMSTMTWDMGSGTT